MPTFLPFFQLQFYRIASVLLNPWSQLDYSLPHLLLIKFQPFSEIDIPKMFSLPRSLFTFFTKTKQIMKFHAILNWDHCPQPNTDMKKTWMNFSPAIQESKLKKLHFQEVQIFGQYQMSLTDAQVRLVKTWIEKKSEH